MGCFEYAALWDFDAAVWLDFADAAVHVDADGVLLLRTLHADQAFSSEKVNKIFDIWCGGLFEKFGTQWFR